MNRFALIGFYRSLVRHKLYAALNIGGLAVGIAVFLVLGSLTYGSRPSFETLAASTTDQIYTIESRTNDDDLDDLKARQRHACCGVVGNQSRSAEHDRNPDRPAQRDRPQGRDRRPREQMALVDPDFFSVFALPVVAGDTRDVLASPSNAVITQRTAHKYFPVTAPPSDER